MCSLREVYCTGTLRVLKWSTKLLPRRLSPTTKGSCGRSGYFELSTGKFYLKCEKKLPLINDQWQRENLMPTVVSKVARYRFTSRVFGLLKMCVDEASIFVSPEA